jgi:DnaK suppressor protein
MAEQQKKGMTFICIPEYELKEGEAYMNVEQLKHFQELCVAWKHQLMEEADRAIDFLHQDAEVISDVMDRATHEEERNLELKRRNRERKLIAKIDHTVTQIINKQYGYCDSCGSEIGVKRLEARPTATECVDCKTFAENKEKRDQS